MFIVLRVRARARKFRLIANVTGIDDERRNDVKGDVRGFINAARAGGSRFFFGKRVIARDDANKEIRR